MENKTILYFDHTFHEYKQLMYEYMPAGFELWFWEEMNNEEREDKLEKADYLMVATKKLGHEIFSKAKKAKFIQKTGIGVDHIDLKAANRFGLPVSNTPGANAAGVAELTILLILSLYRKLPPLNHSTKDGEWLMWELRTHSFEMKGKTHGFIGFGNIGREAAILSKAFGTNIIYYDKMRASKDVEEDLNAKYITMEEILKTADIITLHLPLLPETRHLIGKNELQMMKQTSILINVARGGIVDEKALFDALQKGIISGAGIDVWESEPVHPDNPLLGLDNVITTPHIGAGTKDTLDRVLQMAFSNIKKVESGEKPNYVLNDVTKRRLIHELGNK
ncbi:3-phosphoglycerate dehydrogenase [Peribacillus cavernae]|uniref:3-phosphoglycerate dehydrogenase n=1 Tax=Peribacillus cavernae TaxID=1674310 RepID=A0A3S0W539_9BACI|nr:2-hydroxyacid dehydrogenase [Peribacillus cavernae]MDQ0221142.1 phosphoglycerate dehydrogenase-like enzyme [Peribacillus cavernae]RUQ32818.1 3-phosphoglycerate dehydrogenase [Peribacillus cavernae]